MLNQNSYYSSRAQASEVGRSGGYAIHATEGPYGLVSQTLVFAIIIAMKTVTISSKGQFTIPKALRKRLGMQPGNTVELWVEKGRLRARLRKVMPKQPRRP
jgi:AbrB family looped-hinge helix DNA binding protein